MSIATTRPTPNNSTQTAPVSTTAPSATADVDFIDVNTVQAVKWLVTVYDATAVKAVAFEVFALHRNGSNPVHTIADKVGDVSINYSVDVVIVGTTMVLQVTNNEAVNLTINSTKTVVLL